MDEKTDTRLLASSAPAAPSDSSQAVTVARCVLRSAHTVRCPHCLAGGLPQRLRLTASTRRGLRTSASTAALVDELQSRTFVGASERHPFAKGAFANRHD